MIMYGKRFQLMLMAVVLLVVGFGLFLTGCTDEDKENIIPNVTLSTLTLDFGAVPVGQLSLSKTVTLNNLNDSAVTVERVTLTNGVFRVGGYIDATGALIPLVTPFTIAKNGASTLYVLFAPTAATAYTGKLVIESVNANARTETDMADLSGTGLAPTIR